MFNVMKAQTYQLLRSNSTYYTFLFGLFMSGLSAAIMIADGADVQLMGSTWLIIMNGTFGLLLPVIAVIFSVLVCSSDIADKTINYEVLTGKRRIDVYLGRAIVCMVMTLLCCLVSVVMPILCITAVNGWGYTMTVSDAALRMAAMLPPMIRLSAFFTVISFIIGSKGPVIAADSVVILLEMLAVSFEKLFPGDLAMYLFSADLLDRVLTVKNLGYGFENGEDIRVVKDVLEMSTVGTTAVSSLAGTIVFLLLGYAVFRKRDMN